MVSPFPACVLTKSESEKGSMICPPVSVYRESTSCDGTVFLVYLPVYPTIPAGKSTRTETSFNKGNSSGNSSGHSSSGSSSSITAKQIIT